MSAVCWWNRWRMRPRDAGCTMPRKVLIGDALSGSLLALSRSLSLSRFRGKSATDTSDGERLRNTEGHGRERGTEREDARQRARVTPTHIYTHAQRERERPRSRATHPESEREAVTRRGGSDHLHASWVANCLRVTLEKRNTGDRERERGQQRAREREREPDSRDTRVARVTPARRHHLSLSLSLCFRFCCSRLSFRPCHCLSLSLSRKSNEKEIPATHHSLAHVTHSRHCGLHSQVTLWCSPPQACECSKCRRSHPVPSCRWLVGTKSFRTAVLDNLTGSEHAHTRTANLVPLPLTALPLSTLSTEFTALESFVRNAISED